MAREPTPQMSVQHCYSYPKPAMRSNLRGRLTPTNTTMEGERPPRSYIFLMSEELANASRISADHWESEQ